MILGRLVMENFSVYGDRQYIDLAPPNSEHPIILIGGLNGAGKTSLLTAVRLALYGKRIMQLTPERISYGTFLRGLVHHRSKGRVSVELEFHTYTLGRKDTYRIHRAWEIGADGKVDEVVRAWKNGQEDPVLASTWDDFIDALLPASISHLFFFDGEKVAEMANEAGVCALLRTGVQSLLGIDLLSRLQSDLADLIAKKTKATSTDEDAKRLATLETEIQEYESYREKLKEEITDLNVVYSDAQDALAKVEARFKEAGGHLYMDRLQTEKALKEAKAALEENNAALIELAAGALPLALVPNLLNAVREQDRREQDAGLAQSMLGVLENRDQRALSLVAAESGELRDRLASFFEQDRAQRAKATQTETYLHLDATGRDQLNRLDAMLALERERSATLLQAREVIETRLAEAEKRSTMTPPKGVIQGIMAEREKLHRQLANFDQKLAGLEHKLEECEGAVVFRDKERDRILRRLSSTQAGEDVDSRIVRYAQKARERAGEYALKVQERALGELEMLFLDSLQQLFRKVGFVCRVVIDPEAYSLHLFDGQDQVVPLDRLSAGERQLVVIAILWGLGRASGRPLPLIIDTPLGRLDSKHRDNLLDYYLPMASHQTILLATDAEITKADLPRLSPYLGGSHILVHDDATRRTVVRPGFFWSAA